MTNLIKAVAAVADESSDSEAILAGLRTLFQAQSQRPAGRRAIQQFKHALLKDDIQAFLAQIGGGTVPGRRGRPVAVAAGDGRRGPRGDFNKDGSPRKKPGRKSQAELEAIAEAERQAAAEKSAKESRNNDDAEFEAAGGSARGGGGSKETAVPSDGPKQKSTNKPAAQSKVPTRKSPASKKATVNEHQVSAS